VVARNPTYRAARSIPLAAIHFLAFDSGDSEERAFRAGQLDVTMSVPFHKLPAYRASQPPVLRSVRQQETRYLALNTTKSPLNDRRVRQALALALNRRTLTEKVLQGGQVPAYSFIPPGLGQHTSGLALEEDLTEARRLLTAAGFPQGRGFPRLELTTWHPAPVLEVIQQVWRRELGLEITLAQREARTHLAALAAGDYDLALVTAIPDYPSAADLFTQLTSGHPANYPHWRNAEYDDLVRAANTQASPALRHRHYALAEKILLEDMPLIPLYFNVQNFLIQPNVKNWRTDSLWTRFFSGLTRE
jgi:oligopeptide transport system substrate-binding protein